MRIQAINVEIRRGQGKPLFYSFNPLTVGHEKFFLLAGLAEGLIKSDDFRQRLGKRDRKLSLEAAKN